MNNELIAKMYTLAADRATKAFEQITILVAVIQALKAEGLDLSGQVKDWMEHMPTNYRITTKDLPTIRKVVGSLRVRSKALANAYGSNGSNDVEVYLEPTGGKYKGMVTFRYVTPLRGNKCHVETVQSTAYTYKTLVCKA